MIIAFDIDDTITRHPPFFALLTRALADTGHRVLIITFRDDRAVTQADLRAWGVTYDELVCWSAAENDLAEADVWKATVCRRHGVDIFFEDDPDVLAHVDPATVCFMPVEARRDAAA